MTDIEKILEMRKKNIIDLRNEIDPQARFALKIRINTLGQVLDVLGYEESEENLDDLITFIEE